MAALNDYLAEKSAALAQRIARIEAGELGVQTLSAEVSAEGRSGVRRIRIRDFQVLSDSPPDFAGYDFGPSSPELQLGVLGSCLTHSYLIQAARLGIKIDDIKVDVTGQVDARAGHPAHLDKSIPVHPHDLAFTVHITSPAPAADIARLESEVERSCPILNLLRKSQEIRGLVDHIRPAAGEPPANDTKAGGAA